MLDIHFLWQLDFLSLDYETMSVTVQTSLNNMTYSSGLPSQF